MTLELSTSINKCLGKKDCFQRLFTIPFLPNIVLNFLGGKEYLGRIARVNQLGLHYIAVHGNRLGQAHYCALLPGVKVEVLPIGTDYLAAYKLAYPDIFIPE